MTKQAAPSPEPEKKPVESRGRFIDFAPRRPKSTPVRHETEELSIEDIEEDFEEPIREPSLRKELEEPKGPKEPKEPEIDSEEPKEAPERPVRRARKPLINTSGIFDFIRPKAPRRASPEVVEPLEDEIIEEGLETAHKEPVVEELSKDTASEEQSKDAVYEELSKDVTYDEPVETVVEKISVTSIKHTAAPINKHLTVADVIRPRRVARRPQITPDEVAGFADDKVEEPSIFTADELKQFSDDDDMPPVNEDDLAVALAGFADEPDSPGLSTPVQADNLSREAADFAEEIDALDELSSGDGNKIDKELARALELEAEDFVSEPKALFEEKEVHNEHVSDQDFASGRGINYDPLVKDAERAEEEARKRAEEKEKARIAKAKAEAPDGNMYTLGGRSPFLTSVHVEKRPLSQYVPSNMTSLETMANTPVKNTYRAKLKKALDDDAKEIHRQTLIVSAPVDSKTRSTALIFAIILTVLLGAGVGALVYLVFFQ